MDADKNMGGYSSQWTREQDKAFETALVIHPEGSIDRWEKIAEAVPGKTVEELKHHYELLVEDINNIELGLVPVPNYSTTTTTSASSSSTNNHAGAGGSSTRRRRGTTWTKNEHRLFLEGLEKYGQGDWRSIARYSVVTRSATQVASHAQKYFLRLNSTDDTEKKRTSIFDSK